MAPYTDETPISVILEQSTKYTPRQLILLHGDVETLKHQPTDYEITNLYDNAYRLNDANALTCIVNRFPINLILQGQNNGLPESTKEETKRSFDEVYDLIKTINPDVSVMNDGERQALRRKRTRYRLNIPEEDRRPGAGYYRKCFRYEDG